MGPGRWIRDAVFVTITVWETDPEPVPNTDVFQAAQAAARHFDGWRGAMLFRSADDPRRMLRMTMWDDKDARTRWQASDGYRELGLGNQPSAEHWELVLEVGPEQG